MSVKFIPANFNTAEGLNGVLRQLDDLGTKGHERLKIISTADKSAFILTTCAKPMSCFARLWIWLFGASTDIQFKNVAKFVRDFFDSNEAAFNNAAACTLENLKILHSLKGRLTKSEDVAKALNPLIEKITKALYSNTTEVIRLQTELASSQTLARSNQRQYDELNQNHQRILTDNSTLKGRVNNLQTENQQLCSKITGYEQEIQSLKSQNSQLQTQVNGFRNDLGQAKADNQLLTNENSRLKTPPSPTNNNQLNQKISSLESQNTQLKTGMEDLAQENTSLKETINKLQQEIQSLRDENQQLRGNHQTILQELEKMKVTSESAVPQPNPSNVNPVVSKTITVSASKAATKRRSQRFDVKPLEDLFSKELRSLDLGANTAKAKMGNLNTLITTVQRSQKLKEETVQSLRSAVDSLGKDGDFKPSFIEAVFYDYLSDKSPKFREGVTNAKEYVNIVNGKGKSAFLKALKYNYQSLDEMAQEIPEIRKEVIDEMKRERFQALGSEINQHEKVFLPFLKQLDLWQEEFSTTYKTLMGTRDVSSASLYTNFLKAQIDLHLSRFDTTNLDTLNVEALRKKHEEIMPKIKEWFVGWSSANIQA